MDESTAKSLISIFVIFLVFTLLLKGCEEFRDDARMQHELAMEKAKCQ